MISKLLGAIMFLVYVSSYGTSMGDLAAGMKAGEWKTVNTTNVLDAVGSADVGGGASGGILCYAEGGAWDPVGEQFFFVGGDHNWSVISTKFIRYSAGTNTWTVMTRPPWATFLGAMHGYDCNAIDAAKGNYYCRRSYADRMFEKYNIASGSWTDLPANNIYQYQYASCGAIEYFPELKGLLFFQGNDDGNSAAGIYLYKDSTNQWSKLAGGIPMNGYAFAAYNPVHHVMVCGGANYLCKISGTGQITPLQPSPISLGVNSSIFTVDPVSGDFLVFERDGSFYVYDVITDKWTKQPGSNFFNPVAGGGGADGGLVWGVVATPVSNYGVVMFAKFNGTSSCVYLYKHSGGTKADLPGAMINNGKALEISPNPFLSTAVISLRSSKAPARLAVYDISGKLVCNLGETKSQAVKWTPGNIPGGLYILRAEIDGRSFQEKLLLQR